MACYYRMIFYLQGHVASDHCSPHPKDPPQRRSGLHGASAGGIQRARVQRRILRILPCSPPKWIPQPNCVNLFRLVTDMPTIWSIFVQILIHRCTKCKYLMSTDVLSLSPFFFINDSHMLKSASKHLRRLLPPAGFQRTIGGGSACYRLPNFYGIICYSPKRWIEQNIIYTSHSQSLLFFFPSCHVFVDHGGQAPPATRSDQERPGATRSDQERPGATRSDRETKIEKGRRCLMVVHHRMQSMALVILHRGGDKDSSRCVLDKRNNPWTFAQRGQNLMNRFFPWWMTSLNMENPRVYYLFSRGTPCKILKWPLSYNLCFFWGVAGSK